MSISIFQDEMIELSTIPLFQKLGAKRIGYMISVGKLDARKIGGSWWSTPQALKDFEERSKPRVKVKADDTDQMRRELAFEQARLEIAERKRRRKPR